MKYRIIIKAVGCIELIIGSITFLNLITYSSLSITKKPMNVFIFVIISNAISVLLGLGILNYRNWARKFLIFFSGYIIITKILIFSNLLYFTGEIVTFIPNSLKDSISILYHSFLILFFIQTVVKKYFN